MTLEEIQRMIEEFPEVTVFDFPGPCADCGAEIKPEIRLGPEGFEVSGGAVFHFRDAAFEAENFRIKCDDCHTLNPKFPGRDCEVYSRIVGYYRPVKNWNEAKRAEFGERKLFSLETMPHWSIVNHTEAETEEDD